MRAKDAHDSLIAAAHRAQADALEIEAAAKRRLADEYDVAQARGEIARQGQRTDILPDEKKVGTPADMGLSYKQVHDARQIRDAEAARLGIVHATLQAMLKDGS